VCSENRFPRIVFSASTPQQVLHKSGCQRLIYHHANFLCPAACSGVCVFVFLCCCVLLTTQKHSGLLHVLTHADGEMNEMKARDGMKFSFLTMGPTLAMTVMSLSGFSIAD
jgi:hypothetical protein